MPGSTLRLKPLNTLSFGRDGYVKCTSLIGKDTPTGQTNHIIVKVVQSSSLVLKMFVPPSVCITKLLGFARCKYSTVMVMNAKTSASLNPHGAFSRCQVCSLGAVNYSIE